MRIQLGRWVASAASHRMRNRGYFRLLCRLKYLRLLFLFALVVFIVLIGSHLKDATERESFAVHIRYHGKDPVFVDQFGPDASLKSNLNERNSSNIKGYQDTNLDPTQSEVHSSERMSTNGSKTLQHEERCLSWCQKITDASGVHFLSAVLLVRIYPADLAKLSTRELIQWLYYLSYAGFEHVYIYDAYVFKNESQRDALDFFIKQGFVTYVDWSHKAYPYSVTGTQESAYQDCINKWGSQSTWQSSIDIDEYPFCPQDTKPNFLQRFIANFSAERPDISQITMQNFLFLGKPLNDEEHPLLIDRLKRRTHGPANLLVKPIYRTSHVSKTGVHHHDLRNGISKDADQNMIRLNHYWGARLQNWGEDTPETLAKTTPDSTIQEIVETLLNCNRVCLPSKSLIYRFRWN